MIWGDEKILVEMVKSEEGRRILKEIAQSIHKVAGRLHNENLRMTLRMTI